MARNPTGPWWFGVAVGGPGLQGSRGAGLVAASILILGTWQACQARISTVSGSEAQGVLPRA